VRSLKVIAVTAERIVARHVSPVVAERTLPGVMLGVTARRLGAGRHRDHGVDLA
jgi:hypothetical protein